MIDPTLFLCEGGKEYHKCYNRVDCRCCNTGRPTRFHIPLIKNVWSNDEVLTVTMRPVEKEDELLDRLKSLPSNLDEYCLKGSK
jgi:hypothetical protein